MKMKVCVLCVLCALLSAAVPDCDWESQRDLDSASADCQAACCGDPDCDLVWMDAEGQCQLVTCGNQDQDRNACAPQNATKVSRKKVKTETRDQNYSKTETRDQDYSRCGLPMKVGLCKAAFPKVFYNMTALSCQKFTYGGCGGNANNFNSKTECEAACSGVREVSQKAEGPVESKPAAAKSVHVQDRERCGAEPDVGPCRAAFQHWYYNSETRRCQKFIYGGCKGNKNNYISEESCMATCAVKVLPSSKKVAATDDEDSTEYKDGCLAPSDPGPCRAAFTMFYYDSETSTCQSFIYGGCRGNQNRYGTKEECLSRCSKAGPFDTHGRARDRWTPAIFLFITLAVISALLLVTLVVITVRRHNLSRRPSSFSDKEELLPGPDQQSSLESLTIPESPRPDQA